jgi:hypothetical protein
MSGERHRIDDAVSPSHAILQISQFFDAIERSELKIALELSEVGRMTSGAIDETINDSNAALLFEEEPCAAAADESSTTKNQYPWMHVCRITLDALCEPGYAASAPLPARMILRTR